MTDTLPVLINRQQLGSLMSQVGLTADGARSMPEIAAAEVRLSERRPRWRRDVVLAVLDRLENAE